MTQIASTTNLWLLALVGGIIGAIINTLIALIAPGIIGQPLQAPNPSTKTLEAIPLFAVIAASLIPAFLGAGFLVLLQRFTTNPLQKFQIIAVTFALLSLISPMTLPINLGGKMALSLMHLVAAASIVWSLSRARKA
jgi:Family of unknown function (DUF6069)